MTIQEKQTRAIPENCAAVFGQELRKNKELEQVERFKNRDLCSIVPDQVAFSADEIEKIRKLLQFVDFDMFGDSLVLRTKQGTARVLLRNDGTVRIEGGNILAVAETNLRLNAAKIDMN